MPPRRKKAQEDDSLQARLDALVSDLETLRGDVGALGMTFVICVALSSLWFRWE